MRKLSIKERIARLPLWMQTILIMDIHESLKNRLEVLEREQLKEQCGIYEQRRFLEECEESLKGLGIALR